MPTKHRACSDEFKAKVPLEALKAQETIAQITSGRADVATSLLLLLDRPPLISLCSSVALTFGADRISKIRTNLLDSSWCVPILPCF